MALTPYRGQGCPGKILRPNKRGNRPNNFVLAGLGLAWPGHPRLRGAETKAWMRGSSPRKTTWGDMRVDKPLLLQGRFLRQPCRGRGREMRRADRAEQRMASGNDVAYASAVSLLDLYRGKALSPVDATRLILDRLDALQPKINAFCIVDRDGALAAARASEGRWLRGEAVGRLDGVPVTIKDLILMRGFPTRRGSRLVEPDQDWSEDAPATARLREAGAVIIGKTTTPEFGWKALGDSPLTGITRNPWDL